MVCVRQTNIDSNHEEMTRNVSVCKEACGTMRSTIQGLITKMDFATLDACSTLHSAHDELQPLHHSLDMVRELAQAFLSMLLEDTDDSFRGHFQIGYDGLNPLVPSSGMEVDLTVPNHLRIKTCLVCLRASYEKIPDNVTSKAAARAAPIITQGLLEQLLSWSSEAETVFDALKSSLKKHTGSLAKMYSYSTKPSPLEPRRSERGDDARPLERRGSGRPLPGHCARVRINLRKMEEAMLSPATSRLHRFRPPRLVIPEGSN